MNEWQTFLFVACSWLVIVGALELKHYLETRQLLGTIDMLSDKVKAADLSDYKAARAIKGTSAAAEYETVRRDGASEAAIERRSAEKD